jgi:choline dehydrogenase-like flavoprotein
VARFKLVFRHLVELAFAAGARAVWPGIAGLPRELTHVDQVRALDALPDDPRLFHSICAHLFGTAAMGTDPSRGVVGPDGGVWDVPGLHVVDASVFPTNLGVNPQHSIAAVAWRLAERLADRG